MSTGSLKILVSGDVNGKLKQFFSRIEAVNKKSGPFEMVFCIGEFFGLKNESDNSTEEEWSMYQNGRLKIPIITYILGPCSENVESFYPSTDGCELCPNLVYLGKKGVLTGASGLRVAYFSGVEHDREKPWTCTPTDLHEFSKTLEDAGIDILLTSQWPKGVTRYVKPPDGFENATGSDLISQLTLVAKPRYHFAGLEGINYERLPYRNHHILNEKARHATRFIALANVANQTKAKWLYAFSIVPMLAMDALELTKQPPDVTECPFVVAAIKNQADQTKIAGNDAAPQFFYDLSSGYGDRNPNNKKRHQGPQGDRDRHVAQKKKRLNQPSGPCWFCLGSSEVEKHLVVSVGGYVYMTLAKGALVEDHVLILPIGHCQSTVELAEEVLNEVESYKTSLRKYYQTKGQCPVFYERNFRSPHLQIQAVPVEKTKAKRVKQAFLECAQEKQLELDEVPKHTEIAQVVKKGIPYFFAELPTEEKMFYQIRKEVFFPIHFGREVMTSELLLNMPGKEDWKTCARSKEEESKMAAKFRDNFQKYDFTLTDETD